VIGFDVDDAALASAADELGPRFRPQVVDVRHREAVQRALAVAAPNGQPLQAVLNVAGVYPPTTLEDFTPELYRAIFDINVLGTVNVTAEAVGVMRRHGAGGAVVNFSSVDAFAVSRGQLLYSASKAAVVSLTRSLAIELAPDRIVVNAIAPGWVDTPGNRAPGRMDDVASSIPLGRPARPDEIADWAWRLAGDTASSYMTGETVVVSGGVVMR
jgi:3-oxoacyl-[acyl-carrier protein] reductase